MALTRDQVSVQRIIPAPAERIFDLLADPAGHLRIDGSGTVRRSRSRGERRLGLGDTFGMDMKMGLPYTMRNVVTEFEENRRIAWQPRASGPMERVLGGRTWRYDLEPREDGASTLVRETWDTSTEVAPSRWFITRFMASRTRTSMERTLQRIEELLTPTS